ncbi:MAG: hypothetical protein KatS3mg023_0710 [Armatimonadota bacterium]|nr:MAG: hypothetical protein KatS3mg023_0710 [Armatimonadota bacterium]
MDVATAISVLEAQTSRFDPSFSESDKFSALNDVVQLVREIERELQQMGTDPDPFALARAQQLRKRFSDVLRQLAAAGVSVPMPEGVTL